MDIELQKNYKKKVNNWLFLSANSFYETNQYYVDDLYEVLSNWMKKYNLVPRFNDTNELYENFIEMLYQTSLKKSNKFYAYV